MVRMVNFMSCIFHQQGKWERVVQAGAGGSLVEVSPRSGWGEGSQTRMVEPPGVGGDLGREAMGLWGVETRASGEEARIKSLNSTLKNFGHKREEQDLEVAQQGVGGCAERGQ